MSNPLLDGDKNILGRYKIKGDARKVNTGSMGTQTNNWSNQTSAPRGGFNAEIAELSNLRGEIKSRTIFKPANSSSVADLLLHWDGDKILFSATDDNKR
jgi:hypothetical protein